MQASRARLVAAGVLTAVAFLLYYSTLLPGQDLGDTASFQTIAGDHMLFPRQGYPLYFALNGLLVHLLPVEPARATNLGSALAAAAAVGLVTLIASELAGTIAAGLAAGLLLAGSYTFWSQAVIAEVYALHLLLSGASLLSLLAWHRRPTLGRLGVFFAIVALGFGNHLSTVLWLPGFALFLALAAPEGPRVLCRRRVVLLAAAIAALFALQYAWNVRWMVYEHRDYSVAEWLRTFWFDVTKADWRTNMVYGIPESTVANRFAMYWFDLRQQFGLPGILTAVAGIGSILVRRWRIGAMLLALWLVSWAFAFTYNVGDTHVFYLASHWVVAIAAGCGVGWLLSGTRRASAPAVSWAAVILLLAYPAWRVYDTFPAMDRSGDVEPSRFFDNLTAGLDPSREILGADMNWQLHNGLDYYSKYTRPELVTFDLPDTLLYFPALVSTNTALRRSIVVTAGAATMIRQVYGGLFDVRPDPRLAAPPLSERVAALAPGTSYVLTVIGAYRELPVDRAELERTAAELGLAAWQVPEGRFVVVAGRIGQPPSITRAGMEPFRLRASLAGHPLDVRFECWLPADTIRRAGFGHVIVGRRHELTLDRGVSFVALDEDGRARLRTWAAGLLTPQPRFVVSTNPLHLRRP